MESKDMYGGAGVGRVPEGARSATGGATSTPVSALPKTVSRAQLRKRNTISIMVATERETRCIAWLPGATGPI